MKKKIRLSFKGKKFEINLNVCNWFEKFSGLMFKKREKAEALLFNFKKPMKIKVHSFFVFFPFVAIWLDDKNKIIDLRIIKSFNFSVSSGKSFCRLIEIPINKRYEKIIELLCSQSHSLWF